MVLHEAVCVACLFALAWYVYKVTAGNPMRRMPGPRGLPILGSIMAVDWPSFHLQLSEWRSLYGPVMKVSLMGDDIVVISSAETAKEALVSRGTDFAGRPPMWRIERASFFLGIGSGKFTPALVEKKKVMLHQLKASHSGGYDRLETIVLNETADFLDQIASYNAQPIDAKSMTTTFISNTLATMVYGERYPYHHPVVKDIMQMIQEVVRNVSITSPGQELDTYPWLRFTGLFSEGMKSLTRLEFLRDTILMKKIKQERASFDPSSPRGMVDDLLSRSHDRSEVKSQISWTDEQIVSYLLDVFAAGTSTSLNTMQAAYLVLLKYPDLQATIQQEIDNVIGSSEPSIKDRAHMPYTEAFILELLRYSAIVPLMVPHMTIKDTSVGGHFVPANTRVLFNSWDIHHDEKVYPQPFEFRPDRFLDQQGRLHDHSHPSRANFVAFGAGRRSCPAEQFALARLFLLVVSLLQRFTLKEDKARPAPDPDPRTYRMSSVLDAPDCFFVATPRK